MHSDLVWYQKNGYTPPHALPIHLRLTLLRAVLKKFSWFPVLCPVNYIITLLTDFGKTFIKILLLRQLQPFHLFQQLPYGTTPEYSQHTPALALPAAPLWTCRPEFSCAASDFCLKFFSSFLKCGIFKSI